MDHRYYDREYSIWNTNEILPRIDEEQDILKKAMELCPRSINVPYHIALNLVEQKDRKAGNFEGWVAKLERFVSDAGSVIEALSEKSCNDELEYEEYKRIIDERAQHQKARSRLRTKIQECKTLLREAKARTVPTS